MKLSIQDQDSGLTALRVEGPVTQRDVQPDADALQEVLGDGAYGQKILLDMSEVDSLDSSGVNWLLVSHKRTIAAGGKLVLHSLSPISRNVIRVLNLQTVFQLALDETSARTILNGGGA